MSISNYSRFLADCVISGTGKQSGLSEDELYGVYLSWCFLNTEKPGSATSLWAAMSREAYLSPQLSGGRLVWPGLSMTGPSVVDYILSSQPSLL